MNEKQLENLKGSFYGWEFSVESGMAPDMTLEEIELLEALFHSYEDLQVKEHRRESQVAAVCSQCDKATQGKIYEGYSCVDCRIKKLEETVLEQEVNIGHLNHSYTEVAKEEDFYRHYKIAYEVLLREYAKQNDK